MIETDIVALARKAANIKAASEGETRMMLTELFDSTVNSRGTGGTGDS